MESDLFRTLVIFLRSACLYVCRSVGSHFSKTASCPNFTKFIYIFPVAVARSSSDDMQYVMYFRFCGWRHVFTQWGQRARIKENVMLRRVLRWRHRKRSWCLKLQACCVYVFKACDQFSLYQQQNIWGVARGASRAHSLVNWPTGLDYVLLPGSAWNWPRKAVSSQLVIGSTKWSCVT